MSFEVHAFYKFVPLSQARLTELQAHFSPFRDRDQFVGLMLLGHEGVNATVAGVSTEMVEFRNALTQCPEFADIESKKSVCDAQPFRKFKIKLKTEIVTMGRPDLVPNGPCRHLTPTQWNAVLETEENVIVLDTRNTYETAIGAFDRAILPPIDNFRSFPNFVRDFSKERSLQKDTKILMYCTGGIRCEKAILEMKDQGFENVFQLEGGILRYMEEYPNSHFKGDCFVFDERIAVDQKLEAVTKYGLCPHCGNVATQETECARCGTSAKVCEPCLALKHRHSCSKDCAYHLDRRVEP